MMEIVLDFNKTYVFTIKQKINFYFQKTNVKTSEEKILSILHTVALMQTIMLYLFVYLYSLLVFNFVLIVNFITTCTKKV